jgi:nucleoid-associated protein YgaU
MFGSVLDSEQAFGSMTTMARTRVRRRRAVVVLTLAIVAGAWAGPVAEALTGSSARPVSRTTYVVGPGDSLWTIATRLAPGEDPRPLVDAIAAANHVDPGALTPGQSLVVPAG